MALIVLAILVAGAVVLIDRLREVSRLQDCLMTRASNCNDLVEPPKSVGVR